MSVRQNLITKLNINMAVEREEWRNGRVKRQQRQETNDYDITG